MLVHLYRKYYRQCVAITIVILSTTFIAAQLQIKDVSEQSNSVSFTIPDPPILQNKSEYSADRIQLTVKYSKREVPDRGDNNKDQNQPETADNDFVDFKRDSNSDSASPTQPRRVTVDNLTPGRKYKMMLRAKYDTGDVIDSSETISTRPASGIEELHFYCYSIVMACRFYFICTHPISSAQHHFSSTQIFRRCAVVLAAHACTLF